MVGSLNHDAIQSVSQKMSVAAYSRLHCQSSTVMHRQGGEGRSRRKASASAEN